MSTAPELRGALMAELGEDAGVQAWRVIERELPLILARSRELEARNAELERLGTNLDELRAGAARDLRRLAADLEELARPVTPETVDSSA